MNPHDQYTYIIYGVFNKFKSFVHIDFWNSKTHRNNVRQHIPSKRSMNGSAYFHKEMRHFYLKQTCIFVIMGVIGVLLEFLPRHLTPFIEGDYTISHSCGNTVRYSSFTFSPNL